jgi:hypothetical protein
MKKCLYLNLDNKGVIKKQKNQDEDSPLNINSNKKNEDIYREQYRLDMETKSSKNINK